LTDLAAEVEKLLVVGRLPVRHTKVQGTSGERGVLGTEHIYQISWPEEVQLVEWLVG